jgi:hypothetical protein
MRLCFGFLLISGILNANAGVLVIEGKYQNKNVYVQNSVSSSGVGYCAYEVRVNGTVTNDEVNSSAFEIDLSQHQFKFGEPVMIEIKHKDGCTPKVLNPEVLKPRPTYEIVDLTLAPTGIIKWTTKNESGSLPFIIEQFRWGKWIYVGEVQGKGKPEESDYSFQVVLHSGENKFRIKQIGQVNQPKFSQSVTINSNRPKITYTFSKGTKTVEFSSETLFEVYDFYGSIVKKGFGKSVDVSNLTKGGYYLCYDNVVEEFSRK